MAPVLPGVVVDATFGGGGHARRLLESADEQHLARRDGSASARASSQRASVPREEHGLGHQEAAVGERRQAAL